MDTYGSYSWKQALAAVAIGLVVLVLAVAVYGGGQTSTILSTVGHAVNDPGPNVGVGTGGTAGSGGVDDGGQIADAAARSPDLLIVRTGQLEIVVRDLRVAVADADKRITAAGGYVSSSEESASGEDASASVVYRIPADRWDDALAAVRGLASETRHAQVQTEVVTSQVVDLGARIANLRASEAALQAIMVKSTAIRDVLDVQAKLTDVRGQIEQLVAEKTVLEGRAAFGTLTVVFNLPTTLAAEEVRRGWDPATDVDKATGALLGLGQAVATLGIWLGIVGLPLLVLIALTAAVTLRIRRVVAGRASAQPSS
jgi:hypothetical protein